MMEVSPEGTAVVVVILTLLYLTWSKLRRHLESKKPFGDDLPMPTGSHFLVGHLGMFGNDFRSVHKRMCYDNADESGVCSFWLMKNKGLTVTRWQDARAILQASVEHNFVPIMMTHLSKFLGKNNIGTMNGKKWKQQRAGEISFCYAATSAPDSLP